VTSLSMLLLLVEVGCALTSTTPSPVVDFQSAPEPSNRRTLRFTAMVSEGAVSNDSPWIYQWNFGDGTPTNCVHCGIVEPTHEYKSSGRYPVQLAVTDANRTTRRSVPREVLANWPPTAKLVVPVIALLNERVYFDGLSSIDIAGDGSPDGKVTRWVFDVDSTRIPDSGEGQTEYRFSQVGKFDVKLTVFDDLGESGTDTKPIQVVENVAPPVVVITKPRDLDEVDATQSILVEVRRSDFPIMLVEFYRDDRFPIGSTSTLPPSLSWDTTTLEDGTYTLTARAYNVANAVGISNTVTVTVRNHR